MTIMETARPDETEWILTDEGTYEPVTEFYWQEPADVVEMMATLIEREVYEESYPTH